MSQEPKRGCGFRRVGGTYLVGEGIFTPCDRLPMEIKQCPCCGRLIKVGRSLEQFNPHLYFQDHRNCEEGGFVRCIVCKPADANAFIQMVGVESYPTADSFLEEAHRLGISRRVNWKKIPKDFKVGESPIYLAHPYGLEITLDPAVFPVADVLPGFEDDKSKKKRKRNINQPRLLDAARVEMKPAVFMVFVPKKVERIMWESDATDDVVEKLAKQGFTVVKIKDGDPDHAPKER